MKYLLAVVFVFVCVSSCGHCQRNRRPGGRPNRRQCPNAASGVQVHMHTGHAAVDPVHQGTSDDTHIHIHFESGGRDGHMPEHEADGYMYAHAQVVPNGNDNSVEGVIHLRQKMVPFMGPVEVMTDLSGFDPLESHEHAVHIHEFGIIDDDCESTGEHFNPSGEEHNHEGSGHIGDWGNISCDDDGLSAAMFNNTRTTLHGDHCIMGRTIVIHATADGSESSGGIKIACGVIGHAGAHAWPSSAAHTGHSDESGSSSHQHGHGGGHHGSGGGHSGHRHGHGGGHSHGSHN